jgi:hypothetical protein
MRFLLVSILMVAISSGVTARARDAHGQASESLGGLPTATVEPSAPNAPSGVEIDLQNLLIRWVDNSADETGFVITIVVRAQDEVRRQIEAGPDQTHVSFPADLEMACGSTIVVTIAAISGAGPSPAAIVAVSTDCPPSSTPVPALPTTGSSPREASINVFLAPSVAAFGAISFFSALAIRRRRHGLQR